MEEDGVLVFTDPSLPGARLTSRPQGPPCLGKVWQLQQLAVAVAQMFMEVPVKVGGDLGAGGPVGSEIVAPRFGELDDLFRGDRILPPGQVAFQTGEFGSQWRSEVGLVDVTGMHNA